jgi:Asp-tRNA(Asn)/Glu-tRNA(Gln) amidotransferase A subunit family amidase/ketopantoate reductase
MARSGHDIVLCDLDADHVAAINRDGLTIEGPVENFTVAVKAITPDQLPDQIEHVAVAVKSHHTDAAATLVRGRIAPGGYVVSFQNGLTADILADAVGRDNLLVSFVNFGADYLSPGHIIQGNIGTFRIGEPFQNVITDRVRELVDAVPYAVATDNIMGFLWGKEAYGAMLYTGAVSDLSIADHLEDPRYQELMLAVAREVLAQSPVKTENFDGFEADDLEGSLARLVTFNRETAKTHSGIYRDLMVRKRKTEVDDLMRDLKGPLTNYVGELIHAIERGERTCEVENLDLMNAYERTERLGRPLNAVVDILPAPKRSAEGPLHGVAVAVKDLIDIEGVTRGSGNPAAKAGEPAKADAPVITLLRDAAADVYCTTSLLEYAAGALHPDVPEAKNPIDPSRTAGGSSGGSAALVGAGACEVALGTDTGGSIRIPAHYCNVVGFKPTYGALPLEGVQPLAPSLDHVGLLAKNVEVTQRVFSALTGQAVAPAPSGALRVGVFMDQVNDPAVHDDVRACVLDAINRLREKSDVRELDDATFVAIRPTIDDIILYEAWQVHGELASSDPSHFGPETLRLLNSASAITREQYDAALARRDELLPAANEWYRDIDVLLTPSTPYVAPATTPPIDTPDGQVEGMFTGPFNVTGDPAIVVPCGFTAEGLPVGLQLSAPRGADMALLAAALVVEAALADER